MTAKTPCTDAADVMFCSCSCRNVSFETTAHPVAAGPHRQRQVSWSPVDEPGADRVLHPVETCFKTGLLRHWHPHLQGNSKSSQIISLLITKRGNSSSRHSTEHRFRIYISHIARKGHYVTESRLGARLWWQICSVLSSDEEMRPGKERTHFREQASDYFF